MLTQEILSQFAQIAPIETDEDVQLLDGVPEDRKLSLVERTLGRILPIPYDKKAI